MPLVAFYGWTEAELLTALKAAQKDYAAGASTSASGAGDVNRAVLIQRTAKERIDSLCQALYELDPETYANFAEVGQNTTIAAFS